MCQNYIPSAFQLRSAGLFFTRDWVEFESTVTRQTFVRPALGSDVLYHRCSS